MKHDFRSPELYRHVGGLSQLAGVRHIEYKEGRAKGVEAYEVRTGGGLEYAVLPDRCMDIAWASYRGVPFSYMTPVGPAAPCHYEPEKDGFLRNFFAGLLTTCGLTYFGASCTDEGVELGLHGRISNTAAEERAYRVDARCDSPRIEMSGLMRESRLFGENLVLRRTIVSPLGENSIAIHDAVTNEGFETQPLMILYHLNYGYPLLRPGSRILAPLLEVLPRDPRAAEGLSRHLEVAPPERGYVGEQCYFWKLRPQRDGRVSVALVDDEAGWGVRETYNPGQLPFFTQWKQMGEQYYVMGLEPGNATPEGRAQARANGTLQCIGPGETQKFDLEIGILETPEAIAEFERQIER